MLPSEQTPNSAPLSKEAHGPRWKVGSDLQWRGQKNQIFSYTNSNSQ